VKGSIPRVYYRDTIEGESNVQYGKKTLGNSTAFLGSGMLDMGRRSAIEETERRPVAKCLECGEETRHPGGFAVRNMRGYGTRGNGP
jgi:hypothetical protein